MYNFAADTKVFDEALRVYQIAEAEFDAAFEAVQIRAEGQGEDYTDAEYEAACEAHRVAYAKFAEAQKAYRNFKR